MNYKQLVTLLFLTVGLAACDTAEFVPGATGTASTTSAASVGTSTTTSVAVSSAPATAAQVLAAVDQSQSSVAGAFEEMGAPISQIDSGAVTPPSESRPYYGEPERCLLLPVTPPPKSEKSPEPVPDQLSLPTGRCLSVAEFLQGMLHIVDSQCQIFQSIPKADLDVLKAALGGAIASLKRLNLTNISSAVQQVVQANIIIMERLLARLP